MGSIFKTIPGNTIKGFGGRLRPIPFYLQFVPGVVIEVVHSTESLRYGGEKTINTIIALPHATDKAYKNKSTASEQFRYYPLLRTINDVPSKGDPVLLCTIGKVNYYLGPINTPNNSPTWNDDPNYKPEAVLDAANSGKVGVRGAKGESLNFNKQLKYKRLTKKKIEGLDHGPDIYETTGDTIIEGRHGNSLRIGSRSNNPYVFISNNRPVTNNMETFADGSLISITSNGSLQQHFKSYIKSKLIFDSVTNRFQRQYDNSGGILGEVVNGFILASDSIEQSNSYMGSMVSFVNNNQNTQQLVYDYNENQMLFNSDRIIINSKLDDIYVSSIKDIHMGSGRHLTISTNKNLYVESDKTYLGKSAEQPMVLGDVLEDLLNRICSLFEPAQGFITPPGVSGGPLTGPGTTTLAKIKSDIKKLKSAKHFIDN
tara:strand:+ start:43 stop:1326 length:1284 start_codon:yes stop_codon:yes gene_type:complete